MIVALSLRNFVLIDRLDLDTGSGFTALTGETGAGKSIILDALGVALGGAGERRFIRQGESAASVTVAFALDPRHIVWPILEAHGVEVDRDECLTLKRSIRAAGPGRAFVNDQPVGTALLREIGEALVEIHGQHASAALLRAHVHRELLDQFAGHGQELAACASAWDHLQALRADVDALRAREQAGAEEIARIRADLDVLAELAPVAGEADRLAAQRTRLMHAERVTRQVAEVSGALADADVPGLLGRATRSLEEISRLPGYADNEAGGEAGGAAGALERALIEVQEAERGLAALGTFALEEPEALERAETRLFALRAAARRFKVEPDALPEIFERRKAQLAGLDQAGERLAEVEAQEREAAARWRSAAEKLSAGRRAAARRLERAVLAELAPLKLGRTRFRVGVEPMAEPKSGAAGWDRVAFEVETNAGAGFGPLSKVASGGEMARFSLALKCALAGTGSAGVLIFDEADQGVGGAVAAAIGERLARLGAGRQVFAITHSPQVAAAAAQQWSVSKTAPRKGLARTQVNGLDRGARTEEIARMLAGLEVTPEARAAAERLLEETCQAPKQTQSLPRS